MSGVKNQKFAALKPYLKQLSCLKFNLTSNVLKQRQADVLTEKSYVRSDCR